MKRALMWKGLMVAGLALVLLIPLAMIEGQIEARSQRQAEAKADVASVVAGPQRVVGPLLVLSYDEDVVTEETDAKTGAVTRYSRTEQRQQVVVPRDLKVTGEARVDERHRGIFKAQAFDLSARLEGSFVLPERFGLSPEIRARIRPGRAALVLGLSELRGIRTRPLLTWGDRTLEFEPGAVGDVLTHAIHADLGPMAALEKGTFAFGVPLELKGTGALSFVPVAENTRVTLKSPWPCPSFQGGFATTKSRVDPEGFEATWDVSHLARNLGAILESKGKTEEAFGVAFLEPVNVYLRALRAVKYGFLFVGLTFAAFFFFEMLRRLPIHPIQYLLVGLALAVFFLLLISLSERIPFHLAYLAASTACLGLLGTYLAHALRSAKRGWGFAGGLACTYGLLYALLVSEDNALLMGSLALFAILAAVMVGTRKVNWYAQGEAVPAGDLQA